MQEESTVVINDNYASEEAITNQVFYNKLLYLPLTDLNLADNASVKDIIEASKDKVPTLKSKKAQKELEEQIEYIEGMIEHNNDLKDVTISNMSWKDYDKNGEEDYPPSGMQAAVFTNGDEVNVVYRGTPDGSWIDNAEIVIGGIFYASNYVDKNGKVYKHLSPMQVEALRYIDSVLEKNGDEWADKTLNLGGHSKGDSLAALAMLLNGDKFDMCFGINGPGVSPETWRDLARNIDPQKLMEFQNKMYKLNETNDYVNPFGVPLYKAENIRWYRGYYALKDIFKAHYVEPIFDIESGKLATFVEGRGILGQYIRELYLNVEKLSPHMREPACYGIMAILQFFINGKLPVEKNALFYLNFAEKLDAVILDIIVIVETTTKEFIRRYRREVLNKTDNAYLNIIYYFYDVIKTLKEFQTPISMKRHIYFLKIVADLRFRNTDMLLSFFSENNKKNDKVAINYMSVDNLIRKLDNYADDLEKYYIGYVNSILDEISDVTEIGTAKNKLDEAIGRYKDIKKGFEDYKDTLNNYKTCCEETENRFIENLQSIGA